MLRVKCHTLLMTMPTYNKFPLLRLFLAVTASLSLMVITISAPKIALDWARPDGAGFINVQLITSGWPNVLVQVGLMMVTVGALLVRPGPRVQAVQNRSLMGCLTVITLAGFAARAFHLGTLPLLIDEIGFAAHASDFLHGQHVPLLAPAHNGNPALFSWLMAGAMGLWGQNAFAMRLAALAAGTLSIPAMYQLGRLWFSPRVGLTAAFILAFYPAHVHFSRLALYNILEPLLSLVALAALAYSMRRRQWCWFAAAGVLAGGAQYFYHGSRLLVITMSVYIALVVLQNHKRGWNRQGVGWVVLAFGITTLPLWASLWHHRLPISGNLTGLRLPTGLAENAIRAVLAWVGQPDVSPFWLGSGTLVPPWMLAFFLVGAVISVSRFREPGHGVLLVLLILTTVFGGVIQPAAPLYVRYITALPVLMFFTATVLNFFRGRFYWLLLGVVCVLNLTVVVEHTGEAPQRVSESVWCEMYGARAAAVLPTGMAITLHVVSGLDEAQQVTLGHAFAAYGERRPIWLITEKSSQDSIYPTYVLICN